jgi:T5SS/PEP-CTERM-associated repeat protein
MQLTWWTYVVLTCCLFATTESVHAEGIEPDTKGIDFQHVYIGVGTLFDLNGTEPLHTALVIVNFTIRADTPNMVEVRTSLNPSDPDAQAFVGDLRSVYIHGFDINREGNTFTSPGFTGFGLPPDRVPVTTANFVFNLVANTCEGNGGMEYPDRGFRVEYSDFTCQPPTQFQRCFSLVSGAPDRCQPDEEDIIFWDVTDGSFNNASNWDPEQVPGSSDTAVFTRDGSENIAAITTAASLRASVENGVMTFFEGSYTLGGTNLNGAKRSLVVANSAGQMTRLELDEHALRAVHAAVGNASGSVGTILLKNSDASLTTSGRLSVGLLGQGTVTLLDGAKLLSAESRIGDGAGSVGTVNVDFSQAPPKGGILGDWTANNLAVGLGGTGTLNIIDGLVSAGTVVIGSESTAQGTVSVESDTLLGELTTSNITVGVEGKGTLTVKDGLVTTGALVLGDKETGDGTVTIESVTQRGEIKAGDVQVGDHGVDHGIGTMTITNGARLDANKLTIATGNDTPGSFGTGSKVSVIGHNVITNDESLIKLTDALTVGEGSKGSFLADNGALVQSKSGFVGAGEDGVGTAFIADSTWEMTDRFFVGNLPAKGGGLAPTGIVTIFGATARIIAPIIIVFEDSKISGHGFLVGTVAINDGTITAQTLPLTPKSETSDPSEKGSPTGLGLTVDGALTLEGGVLELFVDDLAKDGIVPLVVTGDASLTDPVIKLLFVNGYLPTQGDTLPIIMVDGAITFTNPTFEYFGVADGFEFKVNQETGMLVYEALNDATPLRFGDVDGSESVNIVDLQWIVNVVLEFPIPPEFNTDVDDSGATNIIDVQAVVNEILTQI